MQNIYSGCGAAVLIACALSATISCGDVDHDYRASARGTSSGGTAGTAGKNAGNSAGTRPGSAGTGGSTPGTVGAGGAFSSAVAGAGPGTGNGTAGFPPGTADPSGTAGSPFGFAGSPGSAGSPSGVAGAPPGTVDPTQGVAGAAAVTTCTGPNHMCLGTCVSNSSVNSCGGSCDPCQPPQGGTATCDGNQCGFSCGSMKKCPTKCVPSNGCCSDNDCPAQNGMARQCDTSNNTCTTSGCAQGFRPCGSSCIPNNSCCSPDDCGGACQTCSGPGGKCESVKNADDKDSCPGTCDGSGTCKSKRGQACDTTPSKSCVDGSKCVDGYCCESDCKGQCMACDVKDHQGSCYPVPSGQPHGGKAQCTSDPNASECAGSCKGKSDGTCDYNGNACGKASCVSDSKLQPAGTCNAGTCKKPDAFTCDKSLICSANACKQSCSSKSDCTSGLECKNNQCVKPSEPTNEPTTILCSLGNRQTGSVIAGGKIKEDEIAVGDIDGDKELDGFASFRLDDKIPDGSVIESAKLVVSQTTVEGKPYNQLGIIYAAQVQYAKLADIKANWLQMAQMGEGGGRLVTSSAIKDFEVDVKNRVQKMVNAGTDVINFRFRFEEHDAQDSVVPPKYNNQDDFVLLASSGDKRPRLVVVHHPK